MSDNSGRGRPWWIWPAFFTPVLLAWSVLNLAWYWAMAAIAVAIVVLEFAEGALANRRASTSR